MTAALSKMMMSRLAKLALLLGALPAAVLSDDNAFDCSNSIKVDSKSFDLSSVRSLVSLCLLAIRNRTD